MFGQNKFNYYQLLAAENISTDKSYDVYSCNSDVLCVNLLGLVIT